MHTYSGDVIKQDKNDWLRVGPACEYAGISRAYLYQLIKKNLVKSFLFKVDKAQVLGTRLISKTSIDAMLNKQANEQVPLSPETDQGEVAK
jgi:predicted DNA-binding transcriptional regulator AlpA